MLGEDPGASHLSSSPRALLTCSFTQDQKARAQLFLEPKSLAQEEMSIFLERKIMPDAISSFPFPSNERVFLLKVFISGKLVDISGH